MSGAAMSLRTIGSRNFVNLFGRFQATAARASNAAHMSTQPPFGSGEGKSQFKTKKSGAWTAVGGALVAGGIAYAYKTLTGEKISYEASCAADDCNKCEPKKDECKKCDDSTCLRRLDKEEEIIMKANQDLEKALKDVKPKTMEATEVALKAYCDAIEATKKFLDKTYCAIMEENLDSPRFEETWCEVQELGLARCAKMKDAMTKGQCAWELICRLRDVIANGKACKYTQCNPLLITAEETLLCAEREVANHKARMDCIMSESRIVEQLRNIVEDFRRDLKAEVDSLLTENLDCRKIFTENTCNMILTHAYKKILRIQKELKNECEPPPPAC